MEFTDWFNRVYPTYGGRNNTELVEEMRRAYNAGRAARMRAALDRWGIGVDHRGVVSKTQNTPLNIGMRPELALARMVYNLAHTVEAPREDREAQGG